MTSGSGVTSGGGGGGAGGALTGVVDSGVSKASSESELLGSFLARCWGEAVGVTSTPGPAAEGAEAVCSGAKGAGLARAADGEALWTVRCVETELTASPWWDESAKGGCPGSTGAAGWMTSSVPGILPTPHLFLWKFLPLDPT